MKFPPSTLLPADARSALITASAMHSNEPAGTSRDRAMALDAVIKRIKEKYPAYFQQEHEK